MHKRILQRLRTRYGEAAGPNGRGEASPARLTIVLPQPLHQPPSNVFNTALATLLRLHTVLLARLTASAVFRRMTVSLHEYMCTLGPVLRA